MAARRVWSALSNAYRTRLARGGVTKKMYESGAPLGKARGHEKTPEHPEDVVRNPSRYPEYMQKSALWQNQVIRRKEELFGNRIKWHEEHSDRNVRMGFEAQGIPVPGITQLKKAMQFTDDEFEDHARLQDDDEWRFLWYH